MPVAKWLPLSLAFYGLLAAYAAKASDLAPNVVVTIKPVHALVAAVMDGVATPALLVTGSASPHTFALRPSSARAINDADVFIRVSERLEPFTRKIVSALPASVSLVTLDDEPGIEHLAQRSGGTFEQHHHAHEAEQAEGDGSGKHDEHGDDGDHDEAAGGRDPHIWLDPENAKAIVTDVAAVLGRRYPAYAERFNANAAATVRRISVLEGDVAAKLAPARNRPFIIFHDATQYFEHRFGLEAAGSITVSPDVPPSARRLTDLRRKIKELGAVCVFAEPGFQPSLVAAVTEGTRASSGTIDAEAQLLEPGPDLYFKLLNGLAEAVSDCLKRAA